MPRFLSYLLLGVASSFGQPSENGIIHSIDLLPFTVSLTSNSQKQPTVNYLLELTEVASFFLEGVFLMNISQSNVDYDFVNVTLRVEQSSFSSTTSEISTTFDGLANFGNSNIPDHQYIKSLQADAFIGESRLHFMDILRSYPIDFFAQLEDVSFTFETDSAKDVASRERNELTRSRWGVILGAAFGSFAVVLVGSVILFFYWNGRDNNLKGNYPDIKRNNTSTTSHSPPISPPVPPVESIPDDESSRYTYNGIYMPSNSTRSEFSFERFSISPREVPLNVNLSKVGVIVCPETLENPALPPSSNVTDDSRDSIEESFSVHSLPEPHDIENNPSHDHDTSDTSNEQSDSKSSRLMLSVETNMLPAMKPYLLKSGLQGHVNDDDYLIDSGIDSSRDRSQSSYIDCSSHYKSQSSDDESILSDDSDVIEDLQRLSKEITRNRFLT